MYKADLKIIFGSALLFIIRPANGFPDKWVLSSDLGTIILADRIEFLSQVYAFVDFALHFINLILAHYRFLRCIGL